MCLNSDTVYFSVVCSLDAWMYWIYFFQLINWKSISSLWLWRSCSISSLSTNRQRHVSRASDICRIIWMLSRVKRKRGRNCQRDGMVESGNVWPSNCMFLLSADDKNILSLLLFWHHLGTLNSIVKSRMNSDFDQRMKDSLWLPPPPAVRKIVRTVGGFRHSPLVPHLPLLLYNSPSTLSVAICARIKWRISDSSSSLARHQIPPHTFAVKRRWRIIKEMRITSSW